MITKTAFVLRELIAVWTAEWATVLPMSISHMDSQVTIVHKLTITLEARKFPCPACGRNNIC
jgi:hypothetical protein